MSERSKDLPHNIGVNFVIQLLNDKRGQLMIEKRIWDKPEHGPIVNRIEQEISWIDEATIKLKSDANT